MEEIMKLSTESNLDSLGKVRRCESCGKNESEAVVSSSLVAMSFAFCGDCLHSGLEPYTAIVSTVWQVNGWDNLSDQYKRSFAIMLEAHGKTVENLIADVAAIEKDFHENYLGKSEQSL